MAVVGAQGTDHDVLGFPSEAMMEAKPPPGTPNDMANVVDAERYLEILNPLPYDGGEFSIKSRRVSPRREGMQLYF